MPYIKTIHLVAVFTLNSQGRFSVHLQPSDFCTCNIYNMWIKIPHADTRACYARDAQLIHTHWMRLEPGQSTET